MKATSKAEARRRKGERSAAANISLATCDGHRSPIARAKDQTLTVKAQRLAHGVPADLVSDPMSGHELGKLRLAGVITADEYDAGIRYQEVRSAFMAKIIGASINIQAQDINRVAGSSGKEISPEEVATLRSQHEPMIGAVMQWGGWQVREVLERVIMANEETNRINWLVSGLRCLVVWKDGK